MKKIFKRLITSGSVLVGTGITIEAINLITNKLATAHELLASSTENAQTYHWKLADIHYSKSGKGTPLLLVHELAPSSSSYEWSRVIPALARKHTVYAIDLPGCGLSEKLDITYTNLFYVQLLNDFVKNVIGDATTVIATGLSASFAVLACNYEPEQYRKVILVNPSSLTELSRTPSTRSKIRRSLFKIPLIGTLLYNMLLSKKTLQREFEERMFFDIKELPLNALNAYYESAHLGNSKGKYLLSSILGNYLYFNISNSLKEIDNDIIIVGGEYQEYIEDTMAGYVNENFSIETCTVDNTCHLPQFENPEGFLRQISVYLFFV